jgi:hypothetical protein
LGNSTACPQNCKVVFADLTVDEILNDRMGMIANMIGIAIGNNPAVM